MLKPYYQIKKYEKKKREWRDKKVQTFTVLSSKDEYSSFTTAHPSLLIQIGWWKEIRFRPNGRPQALKSKSQSFDTDQGHATQAM